MATTLTSASAARPYLQPVIDGRPPARTWPRPASRAGTPALSEHQPTLPDQPDGDSPGGAHRRPVVLRNRWSAPPAPHLPDPAAWSASLASALLETLHGHRPVTQLSRWVDERVLGSITMHLRRRRSRPSDTGSGRGWRPPVLHSVRVQCPHPEAVEVTAHLLLGRRSVAIAFRLEAWCDRWLCTALEMGPGAGGER